MVETLKCTEILMFFYFCFSFLAEFRFLKRLILVHGRYSYNRTAFLSQYSFYKSLLICFIVLSLICFIQILLRHKQNPRSIINLQILYVISFSYFIQAYWILAALASILILHTCSFSFVSAITEQVYSIQLV